MRNNSYFIDIGAVSAVVDVQQRLIFFFGPKKCSGHGRYGRYASYATVVNARSLIPKMDELNYVLLWSHNG